MLFLKPDNPKAYLIQQLEAAKATQSGAKPLLTDKDFRTMFGMFDVTKRGAVTREQASAALVSIMGPGASFEAAGLEPPAFLKEEDFVSVMQQAVLVVPAYNFDTRGPPRYPPLPAAAAPAPAAAAP